jgi:hypothetical protein
LKFFPISPALTNLLEFYLKKVYYIPDKQPSNNKRKTENWKTTCLGMQAFKYHLVKQTDMKDLLKLKGEIIAKHLPQIIEQKTKANEYLLKLLTEAIKDKKLTASVGFGILNKINAQGQVGTESSTDMNGEQRLELAKLWFQNAQNSMNSLDSDIRASYDSYLKSIDEQMELLRKEIESIDEEIAKEQNQDLKSKLKDERDNRLKSAA